MLVQRQVKVVQNKQKIISKLPNNLKKTISISEQGEAKPLVVTALQRE